MRSASPSSRSRILTIYVSTRQVQICGKPRRGCNHRQTQYTIRTVSISPVITLLNGINGTVLPQDSTISVKLELLISMKIVRKFITPWRDKTICFLSYLKDCTIFSFHHQKYQRTQRIIIGSEQISSLHKDWVYLIQK